MASKDYEKAATYWLSMIAIDPQHGFYVAPASIELSCAYRELKKYTEGKVVLNNVLESNANYAAAHHMLGLIALDEESYDEAVGKIKKSLELDNGNGKYQDSLKKAEAALKQSKQRDYYKILSEYNAVQYRELVYMVG